MLTTELRRPDIDPSPLFIFNTRVEATNAVRNLGQCGFDLSKLSILGKGSEGDDLPFGFYLDGGRIKSWGGVGAFWGGVWGLLAAPAIFLLPGLGLVAMAGPFVATLVAALEGAALIGGLSAFAAALSMIGVPIHRVAKYEAALHLHKYLIAVHGDLAEIAHARVLLAHWDRLVTSRAELKRAGMGEG